MKSAIIQRVIEIMQKFNLNKSSLAKVLNMPQTTVNGYFNSENKVSMELILAIISKFPDISAEWLLRGEGAMERTMNVENSEKTIINQPTNSDNSGVNITDSEVLSDMINEIKEMREQNAKLIEQNIKLTNILIGK
jgi:plasmid maintenance system antidote protein VapI